MARTAIGSPDPAREIVDAAGRTKFAGAGLHAIYMNAVGTAAATAGPIGLSYPGQTGPAGAAPLAVCAIGNVGMNAVSPRMPVWAGFGPVPVP